MEPNIKLIAFYKFNEINVKDIDRELYSKDRKPFHLFFFNNRNLFLKKKSAYYECLIKEFEQVKPEFSINKNKKIVEIKKKISNFNFYEFNKKVDDYYKQYLNNINYRIDCIFQTFTLFNQLYSDKIILYVFPYELYNKFIKTANNSNIEFFKSIKKDTSFYIDYFDILHWITYFINIGNSMSQKNKIIFKRENIINSLKI